MKHQSLVFSVHLLHVARVDGHAHLEGDELRPVVRDDDGGPLLGCQRPLAGDRASQAVADAGKRDDEGIARFFHLAPGEPAYLPADQRVVEREGGAIGVAYLLPQGGRALDVGEQKGYGSTRLRWCNPGSGWLRG